MAQAVTGLFKKITGLGDSGGIGTLSAASDAQAAAIASQQANLDKQRSDQAAVLAGQQKINAGGGTGLLSYIDDMMNRTLGKGAPTYSPLVRLGGSS